MSDAETNVDVVRVRMLPDGRMTREDAARYLGRESKTLAMWQMRGTGPRCIRVGGRCFYYKADLDAFIRGDVPEPRRGKRSKSAAG